MAVVGAGVIGTGQAWHLDVTLREAVPTVQRPSVRTGRRLRPAHLRPEREPRGLGREPRRGCIRHGHAAHHRPVSNRGECGLRDVDVSGRGVRLSDQPSAKSSSSMCTSPTRSKPRRSRIGRDIEPPWVIRAGVPEPRRRRPSAPDQRSVGASAAGSLRSRAAVEQQAVLGRRRRAGADDLAVEPDRVAAAVALSRKSAAGGSSPRRSPPALEPNASH